MTVEWRPTPPPSAGAEQPTGVRERPLPARDFGSILTALGRELDRGEALLRRATTGGAAALGAGELIALQAGIYRYAEAVELSARFIDRAQNAVRTTLESGRG